MLVLSKIEQISCLQETRTLAPDKTPAICWVFTVAMDSTDVVTFKFESKSAGLRCRRKLYNMLNDYYFAARGF